MQPSQQSEADVRGDSRSLTLVDEKEVWKWSGVTLNDREKKEIKRVKRGMLREMDAEGVREFMVPGLIVPAHVRVHSWGRRGKWGTDVLYQTQRPGLQWYITTCSPAARPF